MKIKTQIKAGKLAANDNQNVVSGVKVKTKIKGGKLAANANQTTVKTKKR